MSLGKELPLSVHMLSHSGYVYHMSFMSKREKRQRNSEGLIAAAKQQKLAISCSRAAMEMLVVLSQAAQSSISTPWHTYAQLIELTHQGLSVLSLLLGHSPLCSSSLHTGCPQRQKGLQSQPKITRSCQQRCACVGWRTQPHSNSLGHMPFTRNPVCAYQ